MEEYLQAIELELGKTHFPAQPKNLYEPIDYFLSLGGKRSRPALLLAACNLFTQQYNKAMPAAVAIEFFHNFTLMHDDIMDKSPLRRGKATVHEAYNTNIAILSGDVLLVKAYSLLSNYEGDLLQKIMHEFNKCAAEVCEGQQYDMDYENQSIEIDDYLKMITLKTSVLLASAMKIGAFIGGANEQDTQHVYDFGKNIGIAFQLQDDILDSFGDSSLTGKRVGGDIIANKNTFLKLKTLQLIGVNLNEEVELLFNRYTLDDKAKVEKVLAVYNQCNVKLEAENLMETYYNKAIAALESVNGNETIKTQLLAYARYLMNRKK